MKAYHLSTLFALTLSVANFSIQSKALASTIFSSNAYTKTCLELYKLKGLDQQAATQAMNCYKEALDSKIVFSRAELAHINSQMSYLYFFKANHELEKESNIQIKALEAAMSRAELAAKPYGAFLDFEAYKNTPPDEMPLLARALYLYGTSLSRWAAEKGTTESLNQWSNIQRVMRLIMRLQQAEVEYYGAQRTLAIANTRIPAPFGDKKLAQNYFETILEKTMVSNGRSSFISNNFFYGELLWATNKRTDACKQYKIAAETPESFIEEHSPLFIYESLKIKDDGAKALSSKCQRLRDI